MTKSAFVAGTLIVVAGVIAWFLLSDPAPVERSPVQTDEPSPPTVAEPAVRSTRPRRGVDGTVADGNLPPAVDLARCDRDLDLFGTIVGPDDRAVAGARVVAITYPWRFGTVLNIAERDVEVAGPRTRSATDGTFALRLSRGRIVCLRVVADGFAPVELPNVVAGERVRVTLRSGVRLVVALSTADGLPAAGAVARLFNNDRDGGPVISARSVSGADGLCMFENLPPNAWAWIAPEHPKGYGGWTKVELPASGEKRQEIKLPAGRTITGTVREAATGHGVAGARVGMNWVLDMAVTTNADGRFELPGWTGKGVDDVQVLADGYAREARTVGAAEVLDFDLQRGYSVTGRLRGPDGSPVAGGLVSLIASETIGGGQRMSHGYATSDDDGRFRVTSLRAGMSHVLVVMATGFARFRKTPYDTGPQDVALGDVVLEAPRRVEGVFLASDGTPLPRAPVTLGAPKGEREENWYGRSVSAFTDDLGRFRFADVAAGRYSVTSRIQAAPEASVEVTVPAESDVLDVKLVRAATREIVVTVVDSDGHAVAGVPLDASIRPDADVRGVTDADGVARLGVPSKGTVHLEISQLPDVRRKFLALPPRDLAPDETNVRVVLDVGAEVTGRLIDPDGAPVVGAMVRFRSGADANPMSMTDGDGRFSAVVARNGRSTLDFEGTVYRQNRAQDTGLAAHVEDIAPGADLVVRCERVARDRTLTVVVLSPDGTPLPAVNVYALSSSGLRLSARTDDRGRATLENLSARELTIGAFVASPDYLLPAPTKATPHGQELRLTCRTAVCITGVVVNTDGKPLTTGIVQAKRDSQFAGAAQVIQDGRFSLRLPADELAPVRLEFDRDNDRTPDASLDGVAPGTQDVRLVVGR